MSTVKANAYLDASGENTATINGIPLRPGVLDPGANGSGAGGALNSYCTEFSEALMLVGNAARSKGYNSAAHLSGYATSTVPTWAAEAKAFVAWRDQVWLTAIEILRQVTAGEIEQPTIEDLIASLPVIDWPAEQLE